MVHACVHITKVLDTLLACPNSFTLKVIRDLIRFFLRESVEGSILGLDATMTLKSKCRIKGTVKKLQANELIKKNKKV